MKVALVHDHLSQDGGAERVLRAMQEIWPEAPTFVLFHDRNRAHPDFTRRDIRPSFIQRLPWGVSHYQWFLPLMPAAVESYNLEGFDVVLSSTSAFAKGVITSPESLHICYCHTPTRYLWSDTHRYVEELPYPRIIKIFLPLLLTRLRLLDRLMAERVDVFIANSETIANRIKKYYHRDTQSILYPPVNTTAFSIGTPKNYYLAGGRLVSYKRLDIVIETFNRLRLPLKIFGRGPDETKLKKMAGGTVEFLGNVNDQEKADLYRECVAYLHPQIEDFGITAIEAMASGRPVIAYAAGGATETILDGVTGVFFQEQNWEHLLDAIVKFQPERFDPERIRKHALQFDQDIFRKRLKNFVESAYAAFHASRSVKPRML
ncbi:MAG: glycosyltransferase [Patescibacteria group bacterium]